MRTTTDRIPNSNTL